MDILFFNQWKSFKLFGCGMRSHRAGLKAAMTSSPGPTICPPSRGPCEEARGCVMSTNDEETSVQTATSRDMVGRCEGTCWAQTAPGPSNTQMGSLRNMNDDRTHSGRWTASHELCKFGSHGRFWLCQARQRLHCCQDLGVADMADMADMAGWMRI
jgi:hypothetical protein